MKNIFLYSFLFCNVFIAKSQEAFIHFIDSTAGTYLLKSHGSAMIIGVNINGKEKIFTYGETEKGNNQKPDANSLFEIGQLTQVFTCALFAQMSIRGEINPDEPIGKFLPVDVPSPVYQELICEPVQQKDYLEERGYGTDEKYSKFVCKPDQSSKPQPILLCYLGTHTSGLPVRPDNMKKNPENPYAGYSKENLYEFLRGYLLPKPIGYDFQYSDLNMTLLGHIMELKSGKTFETLLDSALLGKIGMNNTKINLNDSQRKKLLPGHNAKGAIAEHWSFDVMAPCGGLHSDITDMMKLLSINTSAAKSDLKDLFDYTHNARIRFSNKKYGKAQAALGWIISPLKDDKEYVWQEGITGGFASFIGFVEASHTGILILSASSVPVKEMGTEILKELEELNR